MVLFAILIFVPVATIGFFTYKLVQSLRDKEKRKEEKKKQKQQKKKSK